MRGTARTPQTSWSWCPCQATASPRTTSPCAVWQPPPMGASSSEAQMATCLRFCTTARTHGCRSVATRWTPSALLDSRATSFLGGCHDADSCCLIWLQRDLSRGVSAYLPGFVPRMWHKPSPILDIVIDNDRHILYTRSQNSSIQVQLPALPAKPLVSPLFPSYPCPIPNRQAASTNFAISWRQDRAGVCRADRCMIWGLMARMRL